MVVGSEMEEREEYWKGGKANDGDCLSLQPLSPLFVFLRGGGVRVCGGFATPTHYDTVELVERESAMG